MNIVAEYSFNGGENNYTTHPRQMMDLQEIVAGVDASGLKTKESNEITMPGKILYSPKMLNRAFSREFEFRNWTKNHRVECTYSSQYYREGYRPRQQVRGAYREMDFIKENLGVEVQFGKYAFMVYNVCAKMTIFRNLKLIDAGVEIVPVKSLADEMSTGVSYFEQIAWDLDNRGVGNIDVPVLILGIDV